MTNKPGALKSEKQETTRETNAPGARKSGNFLQATKNAIGKTVKNLGGWNGILTKTGQLLDDFNVPIAGGIMKGVGKLLGPTPSEEDLAESPALWDQTPAIYGKYKYIEEEAEEEQPKGKQNSDGTTDMRNKKQNLGDDFKLLAGWRNSQTGKFGKDAFIPIIVPGKF